MDLSLTEKKAAPSVATTGDWPSQALSSNHIPTLGSLVLRRANLENFAKNPKNAEKMNFLSFSWEADPP